VDPSVELAIANGIAAIAGVPPSHVLVAVQVVSQRRLGGIRLSRRLQSNFVLIDYIISVPAGPENDRAQNIGDVLASTSVSGMAAVIQTEIGVHVGSGKYTVVITELSVPRVKEAVTTTATTRPFAEEWGHLWPVTTEAPNDEAGMAGPQLALIVVLGISGVLIASAIGLRRARKIKSCGNCETCKCWGEDYNCWMSDEGNELDGVGWDEPALEEVGDLDELPEDSEEELDMEVDSIDLLENPFHDGRIPDLRPDDFPELPLDIPLDWIPPTKKFGGTKKFGRPQPLSLHGTEERDVPPLEAEGVLTFPSDSELSSEAEAEVPEEFEKEKDEPFDPSDSDSELSEAVEATILVDEDELSEAEDYEGEAFDSPDDEMTSEIADHDRDRVCESIVEVYAFRDTVVL
jgi:hypothetical protein